MARTKAQAEPHPLAGTAYRVNGGAPVAAEDMEWGGVYPWDEVEYKTPGATWAPCPPFPPVFCSTDPHTMNRRGADGKYHLEGPIWPNRH